MLREKLHSKRGASILLALMYLLVCVFIGAVALGSATTSAQKTQAREADQQTYLAVSSAARLLRDAMAGDKVIMEETKAECDFEGTCGLEQGPALEETITCAVEGFSADILTTAARAIYMSQPQYVAETALAGGKYTREFEIAAEGMPSVRCGMTMDDRYHVTFLLQPIGDGGALLTEHCMTLKFTPSVVSGPESATDETHEHVTGYDYTVDPPQEIREDFTLTRYAYETTIVWPESNVTIEKGVAPDAP